VGASGSERIWIYSGTSLGTSRKVKVKERGEIERVRRRKKKKEERRRTKIRALITNISLQFIVVA
jgi:hypothetical protein